MKKMFLAVLIVLLLCGCAKEPKIYKEIVDSGYGVGWGGNSDGIACEEIKDAVYLTDYYFLTIDGKIYRFNANKFFSNDKNCIEYPYNEKKIKFAYGNDIYDENNKKILSYEYDSATFLTEEDYKNMNNNYTWYDRLSKIKKDYDFISMNECDGDILYIKDNNIYKYNYKINNKTGEYIAEEPLFLGSIPASEKILYMSDAMIKTDKNYYELVKTNEEECNKYVDIKCEYGFKRSALSDIYNKIIFASQDMVVDDNYRMYGKGFCFSIED